MYLCSYIDRYDYVLYICYVWMVHRIVWNSSTFIQLWLLLISWLIKAICSFEVPWYALTFTRSMFWITDQYRNPSFSWSLTITSTYSLSMEKCSLKVHELPASAPSLLLICCSWGPLFSLTSIQFIVFTSLPFCRK